MIMNENEWNEWKLMKMYEIESFEFAAQVKTWQAEKLCVKQANYILQNLSGLNITL